MDARQSDLPILFEGVSVTTDGAILLDNVALRITAGAPTILVGPNGAGKTTLLRAAMGLVTPSRGRITWAGGESGASLRRAIVFQRPVMLRRSAGANLRYALRAAGVSQSEHNERVCKLLQLVGLEGFAKRPARRISGGEQQRLALARALARDPTVLFLDEPTASLDPAATKAFEDVVRSIAQRGIKIVMSTHDLGEARRLAGDVILLHRGRVIEHTPASQFFSSPQTQVASAFLAGELLT